MVLFPGLSVRNEGSHFLFFPDPFGKRDEREPLTNAIQSDSAVIGGKPFFVNENRKGTSNSVLWRSVSESFLNVIQDPGPHGSWKSMSLFINSSVCYMPPAAPWMHRCTHPDPQAADYWLNSWIIYLEIGSMHCIHLTQVSIFLNHKQNKQVKLHMGKGHPGADKWGKLHPVGLLYKGFGLNLMSWMWSPHTVVSIQQHMVQMQLLAAMSWIQLPSSLGFPLSHCLLASRPLSFASACCNLQ